MAIIPLQMKLVYRIGKSHELGHVAKRYYAAGRTLSTQMLRDAFDGMLGEAKDLQTRYLPDMQAKARTLDAAQIVNMVRQN
jgi:hypothetical protein